MGVTAGRAARVFLTAEWRWMAVLNYPVEVGTVASLLPAGLEPHLWEGRAWISLVGLLFRNPRVFGLPVPLHGRFAEVNLRTYAYPQGCPDAPGLVFLKELVSSPAVALGARLVQNKRYTVAPLQHEIQGGEEGCTAEYRWRQGPEWTRLRAISTAQAGIPEPGSAAEFFTQHYQGYGISRDGQAVRYAVEHPPWQSWAANGAVEGSVGLFSPGWAEALSQDPISTYLVEGSPVVVRRATPVHTG